MVPGAWPATELKSERAGVSLYKLALVGIVLLLPCSEAAAQTTFELSAAQAVVSCDAGRRGNVKGGALPDVGDELTWELPRDFPAGVYEIVVVGRSGARIEGRDFVGAYRVILPDGAFPAGVSPHELTVYIPHGIEPRLRSRGPGYYVFEAPMYAAEKAHLRPGDRIAVHARISWAHVWKLRLEPVPLSKRHHLSVQTACLAGLFSASEPARFTATVTNWQERARTLAVDATAVDEVGNVVARDTKNVRVGGMSAKKVVLELSPGAYGPFYAHIKLREGSQKLAEMVRGFGVTPAPDPRQVPDTSPFGIHKSDLADWPRLGAKWVRLWDTGDTWNRYEPEKGKFLWEALDEKVKAAERNGVKVLYVFAYTPTWASARPDEPHWTGKGARAEPRDIEDWKNFVRAVARRYRGRISAYEVWNEPNAGFFTGTVAAYVRLLQSAYTVIKHQDPSAVVLGISGTGGYLSWMEDAFKLGALESMDAVSVHTYTSPRSPEAANLVGRYESTHELIERYGHARPLWNTEVGAWQPERVGGRPMTEEQIAERAPAETRPNWLSGWPYRPISEQRAAEYCARTYLISLACDVKRLFWYSWFPHGFPMFTDANEPRLLCLAYGAMAAHLSDAKFLRRVDLGSRDLFLLIFQTSQGAIAAAWSAQGQPVRLAVPTAGRPARVYDMWGNGQERRTRQLRLKLTGRPIYVTGVTARELDKAILAEPVISFEAVEARIDADVGEKNVREHTSPPHHGDRRVMGLPDAGDAIAWVMPDSVPAGLYELVVDGFTGRRPPGVDYVKNYVLDVTAGGQEHKLSLRPHPEKQPHEVRKGRWYGLMVADKAVKLGPGDIVRISSRSPWAFVGPLKLRRLKAAERKAQIRCDKLPQKLVLDGKLGEWRGAREYSIGERRQVWIGVADRFASTPQLDAWQGPTDCSGRFAVAWTGQGLAVCVRVRDDKVVPAPAPAGAWTGDCVEVFLDARGRGEVGKEKLGEGVYQILCRAPSRAGQVGLSGRLPKGCEAAGMLAPDGYQIELWIPAAALGAEELAEGRRLGFDVAIDDADIMKAGRTIRKSQLVYHGTADNYQDPSAYAVLVLVE